MIVGQDADEALAIAVGQADKPYLDAACRNPWQRILSLFELEVLILVIEISQRLLSLLTLGRLTKSNGQLLLTIGIIPQAGHLICNVSIAAMLMIK